MIKTEDLKYINENNLTSPSTLAKIAGINPGTVRVAISRGNNLSKKNQKLISLAVIELIATLATRCKVDKKALMARITADMTIKDAEEFLIDLVDKEEAVPPVGYQFNESVVSIYQEKQKFSPRKSEHKGPQAFYPPDKLFQVLAKGKNLELTGAGELFIENFTPTIYDSPELESD